MARLVGGTADGQAGVRLSSQTTQALSGQEQRRAVGAGDSVQGGMASLVGRVATLSMAWRLVAPVN